MIRRRPPRSVRKNLWRLLGFSTPREQRLSGEKTARTMAPLRRAFDAFTRDMMAIADAFARAVHFATKLFASLGKVQPHAFS